MNLGFSSTEGVHISMTRFDNVTYNADAGTADVGAGLVWDTVYDTLANYSVNVVGGRVPGVGVAGFTLGGGMHPRKRILFDFSCVLHLRQVIPG